MTQHILAALDAVLPTQQTWRLKVLQQWPKIIGNLSGKVKLHQIKNDAVVLSVTHPGLAQELLMLSDIIRDKINAVIGHNAINAIHFRTMHRHHKPATPSRQTYRSTPVGPPPPLNAREQQMLATIENEELRTALSSFYQTCKQRSRS